MTGPANLARTIEHTLLSPDASRRDIERLVDDAAHAGLFGVCTASSRVAVARARRDLVGRSLSLVAVVAFPNGAVRKEVAVTETRLALEDGADELDVVAPLGLLADQDDRALREHLSAVVEAAAMRPVKVILETGLLDEDAIRRLAGLALEAGASCLKTSTGMMGRGGATPEHVRLLRAIAGDRALVKASGGIKTRAQALALLEAGADRIGTSAGPRLVGEDDIR